MSLRNHDSKQQKISCLFSYIIKRRNNVKQIFHYGQPFFTAHPVASKGTFTNDVILEEGGGRGSPNHRGADFIREFSQHINTSPTSLTYTLNVSVQTQTKNFGFPLQSPIQLQRQLIVVKLLRAVIEKKTVGDLSIFLAYLNVQPSTKFYCVIGKDK